MSNNRGTALLATVVVLFLLTTFGSAYMISAVTEMDMAVNHAAATSALFAADAGLEVATQQMTNYAEEQLDVLVRAWPGYGPIITNPDDFFPKSGFAHTFTSPKYDVITALSFADSGISSLAQTFDYYFTVRSSGEFGEIGQRNIRAEGKLRVSASRGSFADFLIFTDEHLTKDGHAIWFHTSGYFDGRVHTNGIFRFAYFPTFEDFTTSVDPLAWYYNDGENKKLDAERNGDRDVPNFYGGFQRDYVEVPLPTNAFSQMRASLGLDAIDTSEPTNEEIRNALGITEGDPSNSPPPGIYLPNNGGKVSGGIYVQGDVEKLALSIDADNNQVIDIRHAAGQNVRVTLDKHNNQTLVNDGMSSTTYAGIPRGIIYTRGENGSVGGPVRVNGEAVPGIQNSTKLTIVAENDMVIERDLVCQDFDNGECVLGLLSPGGDISIGTSAPNELMMDSFVMTSGDGMCFNVDNYKSRSYSGQVHLRGGVVQSRYGAFGTFSRNGSMTGYGRDFRYDSRGWIPPYWPGTCLFVADEPVPQLLTWTEE
jgi:hypothetical protein